ncbi:unnamed protein product [Clonostachys byssicola]|uniref:Uncharacterized protein n=1 Tax=Clonostachys byssicola TaxID=160290 RepID=A0A9N9Y948_9HYPO|nr:unnamed protein product [Clonostachys byssicola]
MDFSYNNLLALAAKINNCRKTIEQHVADIGVSKHVTARGPAAFNNTVREGVEYKAQLNQAFGFRSVASLPQPLSQDVAGALGYNFPRHIPSIGAITSAKRSGPRRASTIAPVDGTKKKPAARLSQSFFSQHIKELCPAKAGPRKDHPKITASGDTRQFLEVSRTGEHLPVQEQVMTKTPEELFAYQASSWTKEKDVNWTRVYRKLQRTTAKHGGLTEDEFRYYLTIVYKGKRVFFPYHVL